MKYIEINRPQKGHLFSGIGWSLIAYNAIEVMGFRAYGWQGWLLYPSALQRRGDIASHCCSWNPTSSNVKTSSHVRFVTTFIGHTIGRFGQSSTCFLLFFTHQFMSSPHNQNFIGTWVLEYSSFTFVSCCVVPYLFNPTLAMHGYPMQAQIFWQSFFGG